MSSITFPCGCKVQRQEFTYDQEDKVQNIEYCNKHQKLHNKRLDIFQNALNLEDQIYNELIGEGDD